MAASKTVEWDAFFTDAEGAIAVKAGYGRSVGLSNLSPHNCAEGVPELRIPYGGNVYASVEVAYQHSKAKFFEDSLGEKSTDAQAVSLSQPFLSMSAIQAKKAGGKGAFCAEVARLHGEWEARKAAEACPTISVLRLHLFSFLTGLCFSVL